MPVLFNSTKPGFIFRCSNSTQDECFDKKLFGESFAYKEYVLKIKPGDKLFLYNVMTGLCYGGFEAASDGEKHIDPKAWNAKFPWQVKIKQTDKYEPISRDTLKDIISLNSKFGKGYPYPELSEQQTLKLLSAFQNVRKIPATEQSFYEQYPAKIRTDDGHKVRSYAEKIIDDYLFNNEYIHGYERRVPVLEDLYCDFYLRLPRVKGYAYIEYWGLEDEKYIKRKKRKIELYEKYKFNLIQLVPKDLDSLDEVFNRKLLQFYKNL